MRIVAGKHRGLVLHEFDADNIRPTIDRVRENIFNKLQFRIPNACVLDLFGGTGAVSLEFISRGASRVITVDNNVNSINLIKKNFAKAKENLNLLTFDYMIALDKLKNDKFDIIFLDPPFDTKFGESAISIIANNGMLKNDGMLVYEHSIDKNFKLPECCEILDEKKYGTIIVTYVGVKDV